MLVGVLGGLVSCSDNPGEPSPSDQVALVISEPVVVPGTSAVRGAPRAAAPSGSLGALAGLDGDGNAYVSLTPGTALGGTIATIRNTATGFSVTTPVSGGGFDPVPVPASVGDMLEIAVAGGAGGTTLLRGAVPLRRAPVVIRTVPPQGGTDVPLNNVIILVFSEPMDQTTLSPGSVQLLRDGSPVASAVRFGDANGLKVELTPSSVLEPDTRYRLVVTQVMRDLQGSALEEVFEADFTTEPRVASVTVLPDSATVLVGSQVQFRAQLRDASGNLLEGPTVTWSSSDPLVVKIEAEGLVTAVAPGRAQVFAAAQGVTGAATLTVLECNNCWSFRAPMPTPRGYLGVGVVNGELYAVGGDVGNNVLATVEAYDPVRNSWTTRAPLPIARDRLGVGSVNGVLYAVGGNPGPGAGTNATTVEAYDPATNSWTTRASMPTQRIGLGVGVVNGVLYAVGGANGSGNLVTVEAYDPATNTWTTRASMPTPRVFLGVGVVNGVLYAVGGFNGGSLGTVEAYDPATNSWTTRASMPTARHGVSVSVVNGVLYAAGGFTFGTGHLTTVEAYDPATNSWTGKAGMATQRGFFGAGVLNGVLYAIGGYTNISALPLATVEAYRP
jgi:energy-converting hydrogenase Eha subunit A